MNGHTCYTLYGSQPYVLTANWPSGFTPAGTEWEPATGGSNLEKMLRMENQRNHARVFKNYYGTSKTDVLKSLSKGENVILKEFERGYKYNDKILRHAKVVVSKS